MKVVGVVRQWEGGGYYRVRQPFSGLSAHGHITSCVESTQFRDVPRSVDVTVGQLVGGHDMEPWWRSLRSKTVYDADDDPFEVEPHNPFHAVYADPASAASLRRCIESSSLVTVSTPILAERMSAINPNVVVLENCIDESLLEIVRPCRDRVTVGWAGSASHVRDIAACAFGLRKVLQHSDADVHLIGTDFRDILRLPDAKFTPWQMTSQDYYRSIDFDIGLAPLHPSRFADAKSHIKALEYAALGIPVVATRLAPYEDFVIDGVTGFLVRHEHEWLFRVRDLVNDAAMRVEMGVNAKALARKWTIQSRWQLWESAYSA